MRAGKTHCINRKDLVEWKLNTKTIKLLLLLGLLSILLFLFLFIDRETSGEHIGDGIPVLIAQTSHGRKWEGVRGVFMNIKRDTETCGPSLIILLSSLGSSSLSSKKLLKLTMKLCLPSSNKSRRKFKKASHVALVVGGGPIHFERFCFRPFSLSFLSFILQYFAVRVN